MTDEPVRQVRASDGYVAMKHYNSNPSTVQAQDGTIYSFSPRLSISFCWVKPEHVDQMLSLRAQICCGKTAQKFFLANELDVCLWETLERCK
jgi:hypothetical protein